MQEASAGKKLFEELAYKPKPAWDRLKGEERQRVFTLAEGYKAFLTAAKTEREANALILSEAEKQGFRPAEKVPGRLTPGTRLYYNNRGRSAVLVVVGREPISAGFRLVGSHIDSPRLDLKPRPLYEEEGLALLKTHYYGGIKKYQWPVHPLALHGLVVLSDGRRRDIRLGEEAGDPVFCVTDLLPHLAYEQMEKKAKEVVSGEALNIVVGNLPYPEEEDVKERIKLAVLKLLRDTYGIREEDFISAELEAVPAGAARDVGFDRSMVGAYGQDDRISAYTSLRGLLEVRQPAKTAICLFTDKEEVGSMGNTGARSRFFENVLADLAHREGAESVDLAVRQALARGEALSADVNAALDPSYQEVSDKRNSALLGYGINLSKYTGARGKSGSSEASAEFTAAVRDLLNRHNVAWQPGELGKVDEGGGGTIAQFLADLGMDVIDAGVAILSMHSPFEVASKVDVYMAYRAYKVFWEPEK
ncbi:MAG TPA: aminopeptidase [Firmicutes bacterium]|nr:aminopeptidase [Bacillota bacterium]